MDDKKRSAHEVSKSSAESREDNPEPAEILTDIATDIVDEASRESFPASDPPGWTLGPRKKKMKTSTA